MAAGEAGAADPAAEAEAGGATVGESDEQPVTVFRTVTPSTPEPAVNRSLRRVSIRPLKPRARPLVVPQRPAGCSRGFRPRVLSAYIPVSAAASSTSVSGRA